MRKMQKKLFIDNEGIVERMKFYTEKISGILFASGAIKSKKAIVVALFNSGRERPMMCQLCGRFDSRENYEQSWHSAVDRAVYAMREKVNSSYKLYGKPSPCGGGGVAFFTTDAFDNQTKWGIGVAGLEKEEECDAFVIALGMYVFSFFDFSFRLKEGEGDEELDLEKDGERSGCIVIRDQQALDLVSNSNNFEHLMKYLWHIRENYGSPC